MMYGCCSLRFVVAFLLLLTYIFCLTGCTPTRAWLNFDYLGGTVTSHKAVEEINGYLKTESSGKKQAGQLLFSYGGAVPVFGDAWVNNANIEMSFETEATGKITSIVLAFSNVDSSTIEAATILVKGIAEMIDPMDYAFSEKNKADMLNHLDLYHSDSRVRVFYNNNNTRVEKLDTNQLFIPITLIRFSKQDSKTLDVYCQEVAYKLLEHPESLLAMLIGDEKSSVSDNYAVSSALGDNRGNNVTVQNESRNSKVITTSVPGVFAGNDLSLGDFSIGDSKAKVDKILGKAQKVRQGNEGRTHYTYNDMEVVISQGKISALVSNSPLATTPRGIHEGSSLQDVFDAYGRDCLVSQYDGDTLYEYEIVSNDAHSCYLRFAVKDSDQKVDYISMRFAQ